MSLRFPDGFMTTETCHLYLFDDVVVDPRAFVVLKAGVPVQLEPKAFNLLLFLIENRERVLEKDEILDAVWKDTVVTENALASAVGKLRKTLGDDSRTARYIQTVHTRGYRFIAPVSLKPADGAHASPSEWVEPEPRQESTPGLEGAGRSIPAELRGARRPWRFAAIVAAIAITVVAVVGTIRSRHLSVKPSLARVTPAVAPSVAVLPFKSPAGDDLGAEIADALITKLSNSTQLRVAPITAALPYTNTRDARTAGAALGVDYVLQGSIQPGRTGMNVQLVRTRDGVTLWEETFNQRLTDIFSIQDSLGVKVLHTLLVTLDHEEQERFHRRYTENLQAYETFLKAHYYMNRTTREGIDRSIELFQQAIVLDPKYAMAYAGLSDSYSRLVGYGIAPAEFVPKSRAAAVKAIELDDTVAYAHSMLGRLAFVYDWDFPRADREYKRALQLDPILIHQWYATYLLAQNHIAEAEVEYKKFSDFLPFASGPGYAQFFYLTGQYDRAIAELRRKLEIYPDNPFNRTVLGEVYEQQGRYDEALAELQKAVRLSQQNTGLGALGHAYAVIGRSNDAHKVLATIAERSKQAYISPYQSALIYAGLGENEKAFQCLEKAYAERSLSAVFLRFDPRLDELRTQPRYRDFASSIGLLLK